MKKFTVLFLFLYPLFIYSQSELQCGSDEALKKLYSDHPEIKLRRLFQDSLRRISHFNFKRSATYTIPVVFHVMHLGGPENISDDQVKDALRILNRDYALQNPDTIEIIPSFKPIADSTGIQFVLATKDTSGNCTNGIVHHYDANTDWNDLSPTIYSYTWDPTKYLNVYVVRSITMSSGFAASGYSSFPGTYPDGDRHDAIVILNNYFGSIGTGNNFTSRVLTHEVGHWFNLYHIFGYNNSAGANCNGTDFISDTPPTAGYLVCPDAANPATYQLCTPGVDENFQNYMDYSYCCRMFTQGQVDEMQSTLQFSVSMRNNLSTTNNLALTGVINPSNPCIPIADFSFDRSLTCVGVPVTFKDGSWNAHPSVYNWTFSSGTPATSVDSMPVVTYSAPGIYSVTLTTGNISGNSLPVTKTNIITVVIDTATYKNNWAEGFESAALPNADWIISSSSGQVNWQQSSDAAYSGSYSAKLPLTGNFRRNITSMTSPAVNLSTMQNPMMHFQLAAAESNPDHVNNLSVYATTDCGQTWINIYSKTGNILLTSSSTVSPFIPFNTGDWRMETINLSSIATAVSAKFKFVYSRDSVINGNNVFIDDINISGTTGISNFISDNAVRIFPNPSNGISKISFNTPEKTTVKIFTSDIFGRVVEYLVDKELSPGDYEFKTGTFKKYEPAVYFITIRIGDKAMTEKIIVE